MTGAELAISNLAWPDAQFDEAISLVQRAGFTGVEVAPTKIAPWDDIDTDGMRAYRDKLAAANLRPSSLQAIFFGKPQAQLLGDAEAFAAMKEHVALIGTIAEALGAGIAVFGAPRNRNRGEMTRDDAVSLAAERLAQLGTIAERHGLILAMEPVPANYGSDFLTSWRDVFDLVTSLDHPAVRLHLDTGCVALAGDDIAEAIRLGSPVLAHFHAAQPQIGSFDDPLPQHAIAGRELAGIRYDKWVSIEMLEQPDWRHAVMRAAEVVKAHYPLERLA